MILNDLAAVYKTVGAAERALALIEKSLEIFEEDDTQWAIALALNNRGACEGEMGRWEDALASFDQVAKMCADSGSRHGEGLALANVARAYDALGEPLLALATCERALTAWRKVDDHLGEANAFATMGSILLRLSQTDLALVNYKRALSAVREAGQRLAEGGILASIGAVYLETGQFAEATEYFEKGIEIAEGVRGAILSEALRTSYFSSVAEMYSGYVRALIELRRHDDALRAAERGKARVFLDLLNEAQAQVRSEVDPVLHEEEQQLLDELRTLRRELDERRSQPPESRDASLIDELTRKEAELERLYDMSQAQIRQASPRYAALTQPEIWDVGQIQRELVHENTALLEYVLGERGSFLFVVLADDFKVFFLPPKAAIETMVQKLRDAIVQWWLPTYPHGYELYETLLKPAEELIKDKELLIIADGSLHYLPFALLLTEPLIEGEHESRGEDEPDEQPSRGRMRGGESIELDRPPSSEKRAINWSDLSFLIRKHPIRYNPSASVAGFLHQEALRRGMQQAAYDAQFVAFADPLIENQLATGQHATFNGTSPASSPFMDRVRDSLAPLTHAREEVCSIKRLFGETTYPPLTGAQATKEAVVSLTSGNETFRFFHLATHAIIDTVKPLLSGLVLTPGAARDPFWHTAEIFDSRIPSEMVVLSACKTGLGRLERGEGIVSLVRAFMYAGALCVCASLWPVVDDSTPILMRDFYSNVIKGQAKSRALQLAQLEMIKEGTFANPYYWAPFILAGIDNCGSD